MNNHKNHQQQEDKRKEILPAEEKELPSVVSAYEWLFAPPGRRPREWQAGRALEKLQRLIHSPNFSVLIAHRNEKLVGFCTIYLDIDSVRFGQRAWVEDLAVHPDSRSQGIGKQLLDAAKKWAKSKGATHLSLESGAKRLEAHRFYEREKPSSTARSFNWELF